MYYILIILNVHICLSTNINNHLFSKFYKWFITKIKVELKCAQRNNLAKENKGYTYITIFNIDG